MNFVDRQREKLFRRRLSLFGQGLARGGPAHVARRYAEANTTVDAAQRAYEAAIPTLFSQPRVNWVNGRPPEPLRPVQANKVIPFDDPWQKLRAIVEGHSGD